MGNVDFASDFELLRDLLLDNTKDELFNNDLPGAFKKIQTLCRENKLKTPTPYIRHLDLPIWFTYLFVTQYLEIDLSKDLSLWLKIVNALRDTKDAQEIYAALDLTTFKITQSLLSKYNKLKIVFAHNTVCLHKEKGEIIFEEGIKAIPESFNITLDPHVEELSLTFPSTLIGHLDLTKLLKINWSGSALKTLTFNIKAITNKEGEKESPFELNKQQIEWLKKITNIKINLL